MASKPLVLQGTFRGHFYGLAEWAWDQQLAVMALFTRDFRPFVGCNPALERVTDG